MIEILSSWVKQIGIALVIISILEMILPNNSSKKYIKIVLGIFLIFNIVSPLIKNKDEFNIKNIDFEKMTTTNSTNVDQTSMNSRIKKLYEEELEEDIIKKLKDKGYKVESCKINVQISTKDDEETKINKIKLKINKLNGENYETNKKSTENKIVTEIQKIKKVETVLTQNKEEKSKKDDENKKRKITRNRYKKCTKVFNRRIRGE